jgi:hypothetical protein
MYVITEKQYSMSVCDEVQYVTIMAQSCMDRVHTRTVTDSHLQPSRDLPPLVGVSIGANNWVVHDLQAIY